MKCKVVPIYCTPDDKTGKRVECGKYEDMLRTTEVFSEMTFAGWNFKNPEYAMPQLVGGRTMARIEIKSEKALVDKLALLGITDDEQKKEITCNLIGHSKIQTFCFGYYNCARCGDQVGDSLGGYYPGAADTVIVGHKCPTCEENYKKLTWRDKVFCPDPFADEN